MDLDWGVIASCTSAIAAVVALLLSLKQGRMANRQSLFDRRLKIWITVEKLMGLYQANIKLLKQDDEPQLAIDLSFKWLTNTTFLQEIASAISHVQDEELQLKLHLKLDKMRSMSQEATFAFKGKPKAAITEFIDAYRSLLLVIYQYQIVLSEMESSSKKFSWTLEEAVEGVGEKHYRTALYDAENRLASAYEELSDKRLLGQIRRQIRLDSTFVDYLDTFR